MCCYCTATALIQRERATGLEDSSQAWAGRTWPGWFASALTHVLALPRVCCPCWKEAGPSRPPGKAEPLAQSRAALETLAILKMLKMPDMGRRRGAGTQRLAPKLCPRGLWCHAPKGDGEVKTGVLGWLCLVSLWWGTEEFCSGMQRSRPLQGFCFQCGDT